MSVNPWHPWHSVSVGEKVPSIVTAIIEIPRGSKNKYEIDADSGFLFLDRVLSSPMFYPINYGFIPQTYCDDGDPLDVMVIGQDPVHPLSMMDVKVIGCMKRTSKDGFKANYSLGGFVEPYAITEEIEQLALSCAKLFGLEIGGIDLLFDKGGFKICEANSAPGFKGMELATQSDIAGQILKYVTKQAEIHLRTIRN